MTTWCSISFRTRPFSALENQEHVVSDGGQHSRQAQAKLTAECCDRGRSVPGDLATMNPKHRPQSFREIRQYLNRNIVRRGEFSATTASHKPRVAGREMNDNTSLHAPKQKAAESAMPSTNFTSNCRVVLSARGWFAAWQISDGRC